MGWAINNNDPTSRWLADLNPGCQTIVVNTRAWESDCPNVRQWAIYHAVIREDRCDLYPQATKAFFSIITKGFEMRQLLGNPEQLLD